jgi:hypothetical protein
LENIFVDGIQKSQQIANYIATNYPRHCVYSNDVLKTSTIPMQVTCSSRLSYLSQITNPYSIKGLYLLANLSLPLEYGWDHYQTIFQLFPNLKFINLVQKIDGELKSFDQAMKTISSENQNIWNERVAYLKSHGIEMLNWIQTQEKIKELIESSG